MSIAFVTFHEHPNVMKSITDEVSKAIKKIESYPQQGCCAIAICGAALLSQFNTILRIVDEKIGEFGVAKVLEFIMEMIEVFCKYFNIDLRDGDKITALSESIQEMIKTVSGTLNSLFGNVIPKLERASKWGPLSITVRIKAKLSEFDKSPIVGRTINSFELFFKAVEKIDDNFEKIKLKSRNAIIENEMNDETNDEFKKVDMRAQSLSAQMIDDQENALGEIKKVARVLQHIDTIMCYGILIFQNEDDILNPLLDNVDECTRILEKFFGLHPLYQIILGKNYLSNLKVVLKKILRLLDDNRLKLNSPNEFTKKVHKQYPDLIRILY
jgi:hypothetical protein